MTRVVWNEAAFQALLRDPAGPVMGHMNRIGVAVEKGAKAAFHKITGETAASIGHETGVDSQGPYVRIGGDVVVRYLEKPARQMHSPHRWLSGAARAVAGGG
jgi:hypothetical protein